jgi:hypothetical protein
MNDRDLIAIFGGDYEDWSGPMFGLEDIGMRITYSRFDPWTDRLFQSLFPWGGWWE